MYVNNKICIDSCVWIKYAGYSKANILVSYIDELNLEVFADRYLLVEIHDALIEQFQFTTKEADYVLRQITPFLTISAPRSIYRISPDAKDNYLYDLCIQNNCEVLITVDKLILKDNMAPFLRKTDAWLKRRK
jgi:predicted nucleic acid-binding protein